MASTSIKKTEYWNRHLQQIVIDDVYAENFILWAYQTWSGKLLTELLWSRRVPNKLYGWYKRSKLSLKQVEQDLNKYNINLDQFESHEFRNYTDFFLRKFKPGVRSFDQNPNSVGSFCEGRYLGHSQTDENTKYPVKGQFLSSRDLLAGHKSYKQFEGGPILICRLCPIDYHHFHFPVSGAITKRFRIQGSLYSVNVHALANKPDIFLKNEREVTLIQSKSMGKLAMIEVGAMCVGKIIQADPSIRDCVKGQYKGHFDFGASTVILLGEPGAWSPSPDILKHTESNRESLIRLGETVGTSLS